MPREITSLVKIKGLSNSDLSVLAKELFHLEETGVYPENSKVKDFARGITEQLDGIHLNHAQDMVNSEVLRVIARKFVGEG
jgi:hypothetical protein